jgi:hypothetical protein
MLKYNLTEEEQNSEYIDKCWQFVEDLDNTYIFPSEYRKTVINAIRNKYTIDEFYELEKTIDKMFWNLRWMLYPIWMDNDNINCINDIYEYINKANTEQISNALTLCKCIKYDNNQDCDEIISSHNIFDSTFYRSFINNMVLIDKSKKIIYIKQNEGSSIIFSKNYFNVYTYNILKNRKLYEKIINNPLLIKKINIDIPDHYYQCDYGYPNMNMCCYNFGNEQIRKDRIMKLYYYNKYNKIDKYWFKLI